MNKLTAGKIKFTITGLLFFFACRNLPGQIYSFRSYSLSDGLISSNVEAICQDSLGYIWMGTWEGVSVFDSKEFRNYSTADGLSLNKVFSITADKHKPGTVWIGTGGEGVDKFEDGKFYPFGNGLPLKMKTIDGLFEDNKNRLWCGTDSGFYFIQNDMVHRLSLSVKTGAVLSFAQSNKDEILVASETGIYKFSAKSGIIKKINLPDVPVPGFISVITDKTGSIFALAANGMLFKKNNSKISTIFLNSVPRTMIEDNRGYLWIGTYHGLFKVNKRSFSQESVRMFTKETGLNGNDIPSLLYDRENILWIGSNEYGISKLTYPNLLIYKVPPGISYSEWASAATDTNDHIWVAYTAGLSEVWKEASGNWRCIYHLKDNPVLLKNILSIKIDKNNLIYICTDKKIYIEKIELQHPSSSAGSKLYLKEEINLRSKINCTSLFKILVDNSGCIWCSALDLGVVVLSNSSPRKILRIYSTKDGLPDNSVREIFQDREGNFWFGGYGGGLAEFSKDKVLSDIGSNNRGGNIFKKLFTNASGLPDGGVRSIDEEKDGSILIGTRYGGLAIYKNGMFKTINKDDGLLSNGIWSITISPAERIWLGTQSGVQEVDKNGIPSHDLYEEIPKLPFYSVCSTRSNDLCFAGANEIFIYQPLEEKIKMAPPVYITHLLINGKEISVTNKLDLQSFQNTITFEFVGIQNKEDMNVYYRYMLVNADKDWNTLRDRNSITYASLSPGRYIFKVVAVSGKDLQSIHSAEISFTIEAPFYLQGWFITVAAIALIGGFVGISRMRIKRLIEIERIRTRIAADLHDEIGSGLTRIAILSEHALREEKKEAGNEAEGILTGSGEKYTMTNSIERAGKIARGLVDSMIDVIWSIDPKYDSLQDFIFSFKNFAYEVCEAKGIRLAIETKNIDNIKVNSQIKRSLQLMTKEGLNNALKYSCCKNIRFMLFVKNKNINLIIEDDGIGFNPATVKNGRGLFNIEKHVKDLSGKFNLKSNQGAGTSLVIKFPFRS